MAIPQKSLYQHAKPGWRHPIEGCTDLNSAGSTSNTTTKVIMAAVTASKTQLSPGAKLQNTINSVFWSYTALATGGQLDIADSSGVIFSQYLPVDTNQGEIPFRQPLIPNVDGSALTVSLYPGGGGITGKLSVRGWVSL